MELDPEESVAELPEDDVLKEVDMIVDSYFSCSKEKYILLSKLHLLKEETQRMEKLLERETQAKKDVQQLFEVSRKSSTHSLNYALRYHGATEEIARLKDHIEDLTSSHASEVKAMKDQFELKQRDHETTLKIKRQELEAQDLAAANLKGELAAAQAKVQSISDAKSQLETEIKELKLSYAELQRQHQADIQAKQNELQTYKIQCESLPTELSHKSGKIGSINELNKRVKSLQNEVQNERKKVSELQNHNSSLRSRLETLPATKEKSRKRGRFLSAALQF